MISRFPSKRGLQPKPPPLSPAPRSGQLAAPDVTLTIRRSVAAPAGDSEHSDRQSCTDLAERGGLGEGREAGASEAEEQKEQIYESLNTFHHELTVAKVDSKVPSTTTTTSAPSSDNLYAKVKKLSGNSGGNNTNNNLNSEFMSIYELTKVETTNETSQPEESRVDITNKL